MGGVEYFETEEESSSERPERGEGKKIGFWSRAPGEAASLSRRVRGRFVSG